MKLPKKHKPIKRDPTGKRYGLAYLSLKTNAPYVHIEHEDIMFLLDIYPTVPVKDKEVINKPVIIKSFWTKKGYFKKKIMYNWDNLKERWVREKK